MSHHDDWKWTLLVISPPKMCHYWWPFYNTYWCKEICDWLQLGVTVNLPNRIPYLASSSCRLNDSSLWSKSEQSVYKNKYSNKNLMISSYLVVLQDNLFTTIHLSSTPWTLNKKSLSLILTSNTCTVTNAVDMKTLLPLQVRNDCKNINYYGES